MSPNMKKWFRIALVIGFLFLGKIFLSTLPAQTPSPSLSQEPLSVSQGIKDVSHRIIQGPPQSSPPSSPKEHHAPDNAILDQ